MRDDPAELQRRMATLIGGYQRTAAIGALARLGVADHLAEGPLDITELAARAGADAGALARVLRAVDDTGLFETGDDGRVALTSLGRLLRGDVPGSARRAATAATEEWRWRAYGHLPHSLRTGTPAFAEAHGVGLWEYLAGHPEAADLFNATMSRVAAANAAAMLAACDLSGVRHLVDVGGGHGVLVRAVLEAHPDARAVLLDLPGVAEGARQALREAGLQERCQVVAGDFFAAVPPGGDLYVLSWILHDWDDASAARVLARCRHAMPAGARLLVIEMVVPSEPGDAPSPDLDRLVRSADLEMLVVVGGRERTAGEYRELLAGAGLTLQGLIPLPGLRWLVLVCTPAEAG
ncbi:MAG: methyltransferase [Thermoleophilia bacterium]